MKLFTFYKKQMTRVFSALLAILLISVQVGFSQNQTVTGVVLDENANPIIGANVIIKGTTSGVTTGIDGDFVLSVAPNSVLEFSYIGYRTVEETVSAARTTIEVNMMPSAVDLDEVVVVGYSTQSRVSVTGAVVSVKAEELETVAAQDVSTALTGQMPGVTVIQNSGWAGSTSATIRIRGVNSDSDNDPLVLVDGFERTLNDVDMSEVDNISVLKDASATAVYGTRGANGVIIVTTKRGQASEKIKFNFKAEGGINIMGQAPNMLNSYEYAMLYNEAVDNDTAGIGTSYAKFTDQEIEWYKTGDNLAYPNIDMRDWAFNDVGYQHKYSLTMQGGNDKIKYFNSISYNYQRDSLKDFGQGYDAGSWFDRINVRSNIDAKITPTTTFSLNLGMQFQNRNQPQMGLSNIQYYMSRSQPGLYAGVIDGKIIRVDTGYYQDGASGLLFYEAIYDSGKKQTKTNKLQTTFNLKQDFSFITKGLTADVFFTYDNSNSNLFSFSQTQPAYYLTSVDPVVLEVDQSLGTPATSLTRSETDVEMKFRAMINYNRTFNNDHNVSALTVFNATDTSFHDDDESDVPYRTIEVAAKGAYNYKSRYFADVNLGVSGSENFDPSNRYGFFPAASVGWVITNEKFFPKNNVLSFLKLKGSYGITGDDGSVGRFYYKSIYTYDTSSGILFGGNNASAVQGLSAEERAANPELTWEKNYQTNIGINTQWFNNRLVVDAEIYRNDRKDILMTPTSVSEILGKSEYSAANIKELRAEGYEIAVNWSDNIGKFNYSIGGSMSFYRNEVIAMAELEPDYEWQVQTGYSIDRYNGYVFDGFYSEGDIQQLASQNYVGTQDLPMGYNMSSEIQAGDAKYKDLDGDGKITADDMTYHDSTTVPPYSYSMNFSLNYKQWGLSMLWQGTAGAVYEYNSYMRLPFSNGKNNASTLHFDRWTPETADTARYPRLSTVASLDSNNYLDSDLWIDNSNYIRLKTIELSYTLSSAACKKLNLSSMRIYASGYNLLTFTALDFCDPETTSGTTVPIPPNKVINLGVQISF